MRAETSTHRTTCRYPRPAAIPRKDPSDNGAEGRAVQAVQWFSCLGFPYVETQGAVSDWLLDLVSVGFHDSMGSEGMGLDSLEAVQAASARFKTEVLPRSLVSREKTQPGPPRRGQFEALC